MGKSRDNFREDCISPFCLFQRTHTYIGPFIAYRDILVLISADNHESGSIVSCLLNTWEHVEEVSD